jgi:SAM-dependent methyltransferase
VINDLYSGERQVAPELSGIRRDHAARYEFAAGLLRPGSRILDFACGVGYGAKILADAGAHIVIAVDRSESAIAYGKSHYSHGRIAWRASEFDKFQFKDDELDAIVCFETIEHLRNPVSTLKEMARISPRLICSVPNEAKFPYRGQIKFHYCHYTKDGFETLLRHAGYRVTAWYGQEGRESEVVPNLEGRTLIAVAERAETHRKNRMGVVDDSGEAETRPFPQPAPLVPGSRSFEVGEIYKAPKTLIPTVVPDRVAILGLGPSLTIYLELAKRLGGRKAMFDETWAINALGDVIACDRIFHMDDVRIQQGRADAEPEGGIAVMLRWLRGHPGPIYTSRPHDDYPGMVAYPLEDVLNTGGFPYFNSTAAYAIAYAIHIGVKKICLFGMDFTYANVHQAEKGRACVEFWLGIAAARGIDIMIAQNSTLMDAREPPAMKLYGYDTLDVSIEQGEGRRMAVSMVERPPESVPTTDEIEERYDHNQHTCADLVEGAQ